MKALIYRHGSYTYFICFREVPASMGIHKAKTYETKGNNVAMATKEQLNIEDLVIDPEFESVIPPLTQLEFDQLRKNILEDKEVFHPIIVWNKMLPVRLIMNEKNMFSFTSIYSTSNSLLFRRIQYHFPSF